MSNDIFNKVKKVLGKTAKKAAKVSGDAVDYTKLKIKLSGINDELDELYAKIGKIVYERDESQNTDVIFEAIEELRKEKEELKEKLEAFGNKKSCEFCGAKLDNDSKYCSGCGNEIK